MSKYTEVIDNYITRWPTAYKFIKAHQNYRVPRGIPIPVSSWNLGEDYMEGDVIFTFNNELDKRPDLMDFADGRDWEGVLYLMEDEFGFRRLVPRPTYKKGTVIKTMWTINSGWNTTSTSWGLNTLPHRFIIVIPFKNMLRDSALLNWNTNPFEVKQ